MYGECSWMKRCGAAIEHVPTHSTWLAASSAENALRLRRAADDREHVELLGGLVGVGLGRDLVGLQAGALDLHELDLAARRARTGSRTSGRSP